MQAKPIFAKFPQAEWVRLAAEASVALQPVRPPEEVLCDPALIEDGWIADVDDPIWVCSVNRACSIDWGARQVQCGARHRDAVSTPPSCA
jgi:crotonobetainyl-CoA:carnitine CoA-transferase CaiB-like acyl-CoA transferase